MTSSETFQQFAYVSPSRTDALATISSAHGTSRSIPLVLSYRPADTGLVHRPPMTISESRDAFSSEGGDAHASALIPITSVRMVARCPCRRARCMRQLHTMYVPCLHWAFARICSE